MIMSCAGRAWTGHYGQLGADGQRVATIARRLETDADGLHLHCDTDQPQHAAGDIRAELSPATKKPAKRRVILCFPDGVACLKTLNWCPRGDSNPYDLRRYHLKVVRLPVPPPGQVCCSVFDRCLVGGRNLALTFGSGRSGRLRSRNGTVAGWNGRRNFRARGGRGSCRRRVRRSRRFAQGAHHAQVFGA